MIRDSWYKPILHPYEFEFRLFVNVKSCFEFPVMCEKAIQIILRDSVIRKGIGDPFRTLL